MLRLKTALLATEAGRGLGHIKRLAAIAGELKQHGWHTILSSFRLAQLGADASAFDEILPAPGWPGLQNETGFRKAHDPKSPATSYASMLSHFGAADPVVVRNQLLTWSSLLARTNPTVVVGDYAPGCMLAAAGRVPAFAVGNGFTVPALLNGRFVPFRDAASDADLQMQNQVLQAIWEGCRDAGKTIAREPFEAIRGDAAYPICYRLFDCAQGRRIEAVLPPDMPGLNDETLNWDGERTKTFVYLGSDALLYRHLFETIVQNCPQTEFYRDVLHGDQASLRPASLRKDAFSLIEIAKECALFIHHGGLGTTQMCAAAGVPQLIIYTDIEKWLNAQVISKSGAGIGISLHKATPENVAKAASLLLRDDVYRRSARILAMKVGSERSEATALATITRAIIARAAA